VLGVEGEQYKLMCRSAIEEKYCIEGNQFSCDLGFWTVCPVMLGLLIDGKHFHVLKNYDNRFLICD